MSLKLNNVIRGGPYEVSQGFWIVPRISPKVSDALAYDNPKHQVAKGQSNLQNPQALETQH